MNNKIIIWVIGTFIVAGFVLGVLGFIYGVQKSWNSDNPSVQAEIPADIAEHIASKRDLIIVSEPGPLSVITSPITVRGQTRGTWYFEATFPIVLVDWDGKIIAQSHASALLDPNNPKSTWMTEEFVPFEGTIEFENPSGKSYSNKRGMLIFQKDNPSGLSEYDDALEIPVLFK